MKKPFRQMLGEIWAHAKTVRWDIVLSRIAVATGAVAAFGNYAHYLPARYAAPVYAVCLAAAGLSPKIQKAAGLVKQVQDGQVPLFRAIPEAWKTFVTAKQEAALLRKARKLVPVLDKVEKLKTLALDAAVLQAGHEALDAAKAAEVPGGAIAPPVAPPIQQAVALVEASIEDAAIRATGGSQ